MLWLSGLFGCMKCNDDSLGAYEKIKPDIPEKGSPDFILYKFKEIQDLPEGERDQAASLITPQMIQEWVDAGGEVNACDEKLQTPLYIAAKLNRSELVKALIEAGADVNVCEEYDYTPLHRASVHGREENVDELLKGGANANLECAAIQKQALPLHFACCFGHFGIVKKLLPYTKNPVATTAEGYSALHFAARSGNIEIAEYLLDNYNFDLTATTKPTKQWPHRVTPLDIAFKCKQKEMIDFLASRMFGSINI